MKRVGLILSVAVVCSISGLAEPVPFRRALELAVRNSGTMAIANADKVRAESEYLASRNLYLPQVVVGSGLAATSGFPLSIEGSAPSLIRVVSSQFLYNAAHREFVRAAKSEWSAASRKNDDRRNEVLLETALAYLELDKLASELATLREQEKSAERIEQITGERVAVGVDSEVERTRARLATARVRMRLAEVQGAIDVLRLRLGQLTGLPADSFETDSESVPRLPEVHQEENLAARAVENNPLVKIADDEAAAQQFRAKGERRAMYPSFNLIAQYAMLARFNNFDDFFNKFQRHNGTFGVSIRFPFLDFAQRARAEAADSESVMAQKRAEGVRQQVSSETLRLQRAVREAAAAQEVARLEYQLARSEVDAVQGRIEVGTASLRDEQNARLTEAERYRAFLDASFALEKAQLELLRTTGELEAWATK
ncbi:MAG TPA: TolC family protein [Terriglobales bacterium]|nr:TolC family protein [Terriglobales bacterium]